MSITFDQIEDAVAAIASGEIVVVADDEDRENEGDLIMAADKATPEAIAFFVRHTSGVICVGLTGERCDGLDLTPMVAAKRNTESHGTAFTVTVDLAEAPRPASRQPIEQQRYGRLPTLPSVRTRSTAAATSSRSPDRTAERPSPR